MKNRPMTLIEFLFVVTLSVIMLSFLMDAIYMDSHGRVNRPTVHVDVFKGQ